MKLKAARGPTWTVSPSRWCLVLTAVWFVSNLAYAQPSPEAVEAPVTETGVERSGVPEEPAALPEATAAVSEVPPTSVQPRSGPEPALAPAPAPGPLFPAEDGAKGLPSPAEERRVLVDAPPRGYLERLDESPTDAPIDLRVLAHHGGSDGGVVSSSGSKARRHRMFGAMLDVGVPDGVMAGVSLRPWSWVRVQAGGGSNAVSLGVRGGVVVVPFGVGPSLTLEGGHYFEGDANGVAAAVVGPEYENSKTAQRVGYDFANGHLGLELGREVFTFFIHGGISYVRSEIHDVNDVLGGVTANADGTTTRITINGNPVVRAWVPSLKLGFVIHLV